MQANDESGAVPPLDIMKRLYEAASVEPWRPGPRFVSKELPMSLTSSAHAANIQRSLDRASRKAFVNAVKPLRRLLRNQGAVNDSTIEAVVHLFALTQEMVVEISELQQRISALEEQLRSERSRVRGSAGAE